MSTLGRHILQWFCLLAAWVVIAYLAGGLTAALAAACVFQGASLLVYWLQLGKLLRWLQNPKLRLVPQSWGVWDEVFQILLAQAKSRKKRKQKLGVALQRFNRAIEAMPNGVLILTHEGRIEWMNRLAAEHLNLNPERDWGGILPNLLRAPEFHHFLRQPLGSDPLTLKLALPDRQQRLRTFTITRLAFESRAELLVTRDISATEQLNATRTAFVANVSHELRTPLTVINGFLETLADMPDLPQAQQQEFIGLMRKEGDRMLSLLTDLLTLSRLESHGGNLKKRPLDLSALCHQLLADGQALSDGRHRMDGEIDEGIWVDGIDNDLYSALSNLVFNAVRYTPAGGHIRLTLTGGGQPPQAVFRVCDTGPGIAAEHIPHLTERFYRVDAGRSRANGGTGLGLAITKHALAEHQGVLEIDSEVGRGSVFCARLPQRTAMADAVAGVPQHDTKS